MNDLVNDLWPCPCMPELTKEAMPQPAPFAPSLFFASKLHLWEKGTEKESKRFEKTFGKREPLKKGAFEKGNL